MTVSGITRHDPSCVAAARPDGVERCAPPPRASRYVAQRRRPGRRVALAPTGAGDRLRLADEPVAARYRNSAPPRPRDRAARATLDREGMGHVGGNDAR